MHVSTMVRINPATGEIQVNARSLDTYFPNEMLKMLASPISIWRTARAA